MKMAEALKRMVAELIGNEVNRQREFIEIIRKEEFGIGVNLQNDARTIVDNMTRKYRNLLATVAEDLNSKESHFILELIQNADDNSYSPGIIPSLTFQMEENRLVVGNNESGFTEVNVKALCSAGESSKKNKKGYIGEKGIGFKSIFKVTDTPEIHSNGFHFRFDNTSQEDHLGYVVPHWHEPDFKLDEKVTTLVIPAKIGHSFTQETLADVSGTLLLFLGKLRQLDVVSSGQKESYKRQDDGAVTTLVTEKSGETPVSKNYLRKKLEFETTDIVEPKREGIASTEMVLAFPLSDTSEAAPVPGCPTYAFLPIRDFGFSFYIQADFVLISSREGIHEDLPWNIRLRDGIAIAFAAVVEEFKKRPELANSYLKYLPTKNEVHDPFFAPVVDQIIGKLKATACIPTAGGAWVKPSEVLIAPDRIRELFPSEDAIALFGADYQHGDFYLSADLKKSLGCKQLLLTDVVSVFTKNAIWFKKKDANWKAKFYAFLAAPINRADYVKLMQKMACLPIEGGAMAVPETDRVFFPLSSGKKYGFEHELEILDADLLQKANIVSDLTETLFAELSVRYDNPLELIQSYMLPLHASNKWVDADNDALIGHIRYIKDRLPKYLQLAGSKGQSESDALRVLKEGLMIGTKEDGSVWVFGHPSGLYMGAEYRPEFDIEGLLGDLAPLDRIVSTKYLGKLRKAADQGKSVEELAQWREFFIKIGISISPIAEKQSNGNVLFSAELSALLQTESSSVRRKTLECLDRNWAKYAGDTKYEWRSGRSIYSSPTSFIASLRKTIAPTRRRALASLESAYLENEDTRGILGDTVVFIDASLTNVGFLDACGITHKVDANACLKRLRQLKAGAPGGIEQIRRIYRRLEQLWSLEQASIEKAFKSEGLIRVGTGSAATWVLPSETSWSPTNVRFLDNRHPCLGNQYKDFSGFFTKLMKVPAELELEKWVEGLKYLEEVDDHHRQSTATDIYRRLSRAIGIQQRAGDLFEFSWLSDFESYSVYLSHRNELVGKSDHLYANDLPEYAKLFEDEAEISFLAVSPDRLPSIEAFLAEVGIPKISEKLTISVADSVSGITNDQLSRKLREMIEPIARVVYSQSHDRFESAIKEGAFDLLSQACVVEVESLIQVVTLGEWHRETMGQSARRGNEFLLKVGSPFAMDLLAMEVAEFFGLKKHLSDAIYRLLTSSSLDEATCYLTIRNFRGLPDEELSRLKSEAVEVPFVDPLVDEPFGEQPADNEQVSDEVSGQTVGEDLVPANSSETDERTTTSESTTALRGGLSSKAHENKFESSGLPVKPAGVGQNGSTIAQEANGNGVAGTGRSEEPDATPVALERPFVKPTEYSPGIHDGKPRENKRAKSKRYERSQKGRLLSYLEVKDAKDGSGSHSENPLLTERKREVERAAVDFFNESAKDQWKSTKEMPPYNHGFDFQAVAFDGNEEVIEIKGQSGPWTEEGVALTPMELLTASQKRDRYWLCVVEYALDESRRRLWLVQDPFGKTNQFRVDHGWKDVATRSEGKPMRPELNMFISVPGKGKGRIIKVMGNATLLRVGVILENRSTFFVPFNPATMKLSYD